MSDGQLLPPSGGFGKLRSFRCAQLVYDGTVSFCDRFVDRRSRTRDQMVQAARSGVQNIAEGSLASATSKKTELKLTGVARASLGELLLDYEDYLRQRGLRQWAKTSSEALRVRAMYRSDVSDSSDRSSDAGADVYRFAELTADMLANTLICLINQTSYLLWRQMKTLERDFLSEGGFTERMYALRKGAAAKNLKSR